jgi:hypothetical protein
LTRPPNILRAGALYAVVGFGAGFLLGALRELWWAPRFDRTVFLALEVPIILGISLWLGRKLIARHDIGTGLDRLLMGILALLLLVLAELGLLLSTGGSPGEWVAGWGTPAGAFGLAGQILFALLPWLDGLRLRKAGR